MRVCVVAGDVVGGVRKHVHDTLKRLPENWRISYIHSQVVDEAGLRDFNEFCLPFIERASLPISKSPSASDLRNIIRIMAICKEFCPDLIHGHGAKGGLYARCIGAFLGIPVVFTPHGGSVHARFGKWKHRLFALVEFLLKFLTSLFIFESSYTRSAYLKMVGVVSPTKMLVNFNGLDVRQFRPKRVWNCDADRSVRLLVVGLLSPVKGQETFFRALAELATRNVTFVADVCGDGEDRQRLKDLCGQLGILRSVVFHGDVHDVRPYYENCNIVVVPSMFESFGYVAVEGGLMERPVIAANVGGLTETVIDGETGTLFAAGDALALAAAIEKILAEPAHTTEMVKRAKMRCVELFDVNLMTDRVVIAYRNLVEEVPSAHWK